MLDKPFSETRLGRWFVELPTRERAIALIVAFLIVLIVALAFAGYMAVSATRSEVLEHSKTLKRERDQALVDAQTASKAAQESRLKAEQLSEELNAVKTSLNAARIRVESLELELQGTRDAYRNSRRLSDRELEDLRSKLRGQ